MKKFAKLYNYPDVGQVLVVKDTNDDDKPAILFSISGGGPFGICTMSLEFSDSPKGIKNRNKAFKKINKALAREAVKTLVTELDDIREGMYALPEEQDK